MANSTSDRGSVRDWLLQGFGLAGSRSVVGLPPLDDEPAVPLNAPLPPVPVAVGRVGEVASEADLLLADAPVTSSDQLDRLTADHTRTDDQMEALSSLVRQTYRAEAEVARLRAKDSDRRSRIRTEESWKDQRIAHLEGRVRQLENYVLHLRARVHTAVDECQRRFSDDMKALAEHRRMDVAARREIDKYRTTEVPAWQYGSEMNRAVVKGLLQELEAARRANLARPVASPAAEGWDA